MTEPMNVLRPVSALTFRGRNAWLALFLVATLLATVFSVQSLVSRSSDGLETDWLKLVVLQLWFWCAWAALTPVAFAIAGALRIDARPIALQVAMWVVLAAVFAALHTTLFIVAKLAMDHLRGGNEPALAFGTAWWWYLKRSIAQDGLDFAVIAAAYHSVSYYRKLRDRERSEAELSVRLATAELGLLKMQLQPHFLFNTLTTISGLMETDIQAARGLMADLGDLFRMSLDRLGRREVRLSEEIAFVERYLEIQQKRFGARLDVAVDVDDEIESAWVPSLLLQPLVENAIRHGVEPRRGRVRVRVTGQHAGDRLRLSVHNDGDSGPRGPSSDSTEPNGGIGLSNTRNRLLQMYGESARMDASASAGGYTVVVELPLRTAPSDERLERVPA